jgi:hypothetical protein
MLLLLYRYGSTIFFDQSYSIYSFISTNRVDSILANHETMIFFEIFINFYQSMTVVLLHKLQ